MQLGAIEEERRRASERNETKQSGPISGQLHALDEILCASCCSSCGGTYEGAVAIRIDSAASYHEPELRASSARWLVAIANNPSTND